LTGERPGARSAPPIEVHGLVSRFGDHVVHDGLDLEVRRGEVLGLVGGSGAGKSVLLRTLIGLKRPDGGQVKVFGEDVHAASERSLQAIEQRWGVLFQSGALFTNLTVRENVSAPMFEYSRMPRRTMDELADLKLALVGLQPGVGDLKPSELSGGMVKRAGLARALSLDPELLFLDEPTSGLDPISAGAFDDLIGNLSRTLGLTVFMITHDLDSVYTICDRVAVIADKKVVATGAPQEMEQSEHPWIREYFLGPRGRAAAKGKALPHRGEA
jgi:phospholipid/cholesterol/gamma-HCH transport system ATP-binding protein